MLGDKFGPKCAIAFFNTNNSGAEIRQFSSGPAQQLDWPGSGAIEPPNVGLCRMLEPTNFITNHITGD